MYIRTLMIVLILKKTKYLQDNWLNAHSTLITFTGDGSIIHHDNTYIVIPLYMVITITSLTYYVLSVPVPRRSPIESIVCVEPDRAWMIHRWLIITEYEGASEYGRKKNVISK
jgi:hypothetical protein